MYCNVGLGQGRDLYNFWRVILLARENERGTRDGELVFKSSLHTHLLSLWNWKSLEWNPSRRLLYASSLLFHSSPGVDIVSSFSLLQSEPPVAHGFESEVICKWFFGGTCDTESLFRSPFPLKAKRPFLSVGG